MVIKSMINIATIFFAFCGGFVTLATAIEKIIKAFNKIKQPNQLQNEQLKLLNEEDKKLWKAIESVQTMHNSHSELTDKKFENIEAISHLQLEAVLMLLSEVSNSNNSDTSDIKKLEKRISKFLIENSTDVK